MESQTFLKRLNNIPDLPTLPNIVITVNKLLQDHDTSIKKLNDIIEKDQAMVSKILKLVNSTFYGFRSKIKNLPHAIIILGFNTIRNAVVSVSIMKTFNDKKYSKDFRITEFWEHSVAVAVTSRCISEQTKLDAPDDCFVAGLLHDIGKVIFSQYFPGLFEDVLEKMKEQDLSFFEAEKMVLPMTHAQIGGYMAKKWQFPVTLIDTITHHHAPRKSVSNANQLLIVNTADKIVNNYKTGEEIMPDLSLIASDVKSIIYPRLKTVSEWFPDVESEIQSACEFFLKD